MRRHSIFTILAVLAIFMGNAQADEAAHAWLDGVRAYQSGDYTAAIGSFSKIAETGVKNETLFYNLGNAYLKNGDIGRAIWWYERALKINADDPDLKFNHAYALSQTKDARDDKASVLRILFFWKHALSQPTIRWIAIALNAAFWSLVLIRALRKKRILRTWAILVLLPTLVFTFTGFYNYYESAYVRQGVILPEETPVRSGLSDDSTELFRLHAGTRVIIEEEREDNFKVRFSEDKIGWLKKQDLGVI